MASPTGLHSGKGPPPKVSQSVMKVLVLFSDIRTQTGIRGDWPGWLQGKDDLLHSESLLLSSEVVPGPRLSCHFLFPYRVLPRESPHSPLCQFRPFETQMPRPEETCERFTACTFVTKGRGAQEWAGRAFTCNTGVTPGQEEPQT